MNHIARIWVSPRQRAQHTYHLLFFEDNGDNGDDDSGSEGEGYKVEEMMTLTDDLAEWDYGDYEGLVVNEIRALRKERGLDRDRGWDIWKDGCEGGEYVCL